MFRPQVSGLRWHAEVARLSPNLGGAIRRSVGPLLSVSHIADRTLVMRFPISAGLPAPASYARPGTISGAPRPSCRTWLRRGWEIEGEEHTDALRASGTRALFFSGHFGNREMILPIAKAPGLSVSGFYRAVPRRVETIIQSTRSRALGGGVSMFAKGARGAVHRLACKNG